MGKCYDKDEKKDKKQKELRNVTLPVKDIVAILLKQLPGVAQHIWEHEWLYNARRVETWALLDGLLLIFTDFSSNIAFTPLKTNTCHHSTQGILCVFIIMKNKRKITLCNGTIIEVRDCEHVFVFGEGNKNDVAFHTACLEFIAKDYFESDDELNTISLWTDNCPTQYRIASNYFFLAKFPNMFAKLKKITHKFAQVSNFKGVWDAAGGTIKRIFQRSEKSWNRVESALPAFEIVHKVFKSETRAITKMISDKDSKLAEQYTMFKATRRRAFFGTDDHEEYGRLDRGRLKGSIIYVDRENLEKTEPYSGCGTKGKKKAFQFCSEKDTSEDALEQKFSINATYLPCSCTACRSNQNCFMRGTVGEPETYEKQPMKIVELKKMKHALSVVVDELGLCGESWNSKIKDSKESDLKMTDLRLIAIVLHLDPNFKFSGDLAKKTKLRAHLVKKILSGGIDGKIKAAKDWVEAV